MNSGMNEKCDYGLTVQTGDDDSKVSSLINQENWAKVSLGCFSVLVTYDSDLKHPSSSGSG